MRHYKAVLVKAKKEKEKKEPTIADLENGEIAFCGTFLMQRSMDGKTIWYFADGSSGKFEEQRAYKVTRLLPGESISIKPVRN